MKNLWTIIFSFVIGSAIAQAQIPEGGFNNWTPFLLNTYSEPAGGWWTTLNTLSTLGGPVTVSPSTDVHSGAYAAKLETKQWGTLLLSGLLVSGKFINAAPFIKQGQPFTDKPSRFKGWYKYAPVSGDSAAIVAILTKFNTITGKPDTIARTINTIKNNISVYTQFDFKFDYSIPNVNPDTIKIVFVSSADGANMKGQNGSTLLLDDISLEYTTGLQEILMPDFKIDAYPSPASDQVLLKFNTSITEQLFCQIYSIDGRLMLSFTPSGNDHRLDVSAWPQSTYLVQAWIRGNLVSSSKFLVVH
jgi:hypothetical protein